MSLEKCEELTTNIPKKKPNKGPYLLGEALGEGAFAKVRLATQIHIKEKCAIKIVDKKLLEDVKDVQRLKKEIKILKSIRHKNIIQLFDIMESKSNLYFVLEYCKGGELFDYIVKNKRLREIEACIFFQQIINGVEYLHKQGIIHRDLKPENLLLDYDNNIKISDFGLSTFFSKNHYLQTACGTPSYAPPEMLEGLQYNGETSDIWSCGIILYAMLCGTLPFTESKEEIIMQKIKMHDYTIPKYLSKEAQDMLDHILKIKPEERFTIERIKKHPWFNLVKPHLIKGICLNEIRIPVDENILNMVKEYGFDKEECRNLLLNNKFCSLTSIYYLCLKKYVREGGKSISDLQSELYEEYVNNPDNYINKEIKMEKPKISNRINSGDKIRSDDKNNIKNKNNYKNVEKKEDGKRNVKEKENNIKKIKSNLNDNNGNKKIMINKESTMNKGEGINISKSSNNNNKKLIISKNDQKSFSSKNNQQTSQKKTKEINNKTKQTGVLNNSKNKQSKLKNNILVQEKKGKIENGNTQLQKIIIKNYKIDSKMNSPSNRKNGNVNINSNIIENKSSYNNEHNNFNTIIIKKKILNKGQSIQQKKNNENKKKVNKRYIEESNIKNNTLIHSFNKKNKSLEQDYNTNNNRLHNNKKENNKEKKIIDTQTEKSIIHSNTITGINLNNHINKATYALGVNPSTTQAQKILNEQSKAKEAYQNYKKYLRVNADTRNKSSPIPLEQFAVEKDIDGNNLLDEQKPLNVINYIAKKLVSSSFCGNFNFQYASAKKYSTSRRGSAAAHNHLTSSGTNTNFNKESNPINEEIEYINESGNNGGNSNESKNTSNSNNNSNSNTKEKINDINFKNLVSILNQKFKKYLSNNNENEKKNEELNNNNKSNYNNNKLDKNKNRSNNKKKNNKGNNIIINNTSKNKYAKKIEYEEDLYSNSFHRNKNQYKNDITAPTNAETYVYNINDMTSHYNNFLDISTNYDAGLDSRGGSSLERSESLKKNELRNFSFSLDKKHKKKGEHIFKTEYNEKNKGNNYNVIKNTFSGLQNKFIKNINIISENEELNQNSMKKMKNNKNNKNKYIPFLEKKVSINLSATFNNISKPEYKQKKSKY